MFHCLASDLRLFFSYCVYSFVDGLDLLIYIFQLFDRFEVIIGFGGRFSGFCGFWILGEMEDGGFYNRGEILMH